VCDATGISILSSTEARDHLHHHGRCISASHPGSVQGGLFHRPGLRAPSRRIIFSHHTSVLFISGRTSGRLRERRLATPRLNLCLLVDVLFVNMWFAGRAAPAVLWCCALLSGINGDRI
jgi:hypothetical protein